VADIEKWTPVDRISDMRASINISLPLSMKQWVEQQVAEAGFGTISEFFRQLVREEQQRRLRRRIDDNLHQALHSGASTPMTSTAWERIGREGRKRIANERKKP
jgi:antitoxin ParD1/3/4